MVPLLFLQELRRFSFFQQRSWAAVLVAILSTILLIIIIALCIAFPAVQPPHIQGKYKVGILDLHLPVDFGNDTQQQHVVARILYPTDESGTMPYLKEEIGSEYLKQSIMAAAPPPINTFHWFLDSWKLIQLDSKRNAKPLEGKKFPIICFSHGLCGSAAIYSYVTRSLVANGYVVVAIDHSDGSNPVIMKKDGSVLLRDSTVKELWNQGKGIEYVHSRREQTELRARELTGAAVAVQSLNSINIPELQELGISFVDCLKTDEIYTMGHSFGGGTAITVAFRRPDLIKAVIAYEPTTDWTPNDVRQQLFPDGAVSTYDGEHNKDGTGGRGDVEKPISTTYDQMPTLFLFSNEWYIKNWGSVKLFEHMMKQGSLARGDFAVIRSAHHNEFSDMSYLTPLWLGRAVKATGERNPIDTAAEMVSRTLAFLEGEAAASEIPSKEKEHDKKMEL